ncbi:MAG: TetR family transcriptional regulator [Actinomycetes bacterium]
MPDATIPGSAKGERTRAVIAETALRLFRERGYDETTMRAIAAEAGVSTGNAYYYFASKDHLIQRFYDQLQTDHAVASAPTQATPESFAVRLAGVLHAWLEIARPYHSFAGSFFKTAAEPTSPLSPFSAESSPARDAGIALFRTVVQGSSATLDPQLRDDLPELLWIYHMGLVLFWVHDPSPDQRRTAGLIDRSVPMVDRIVRLSRTRLLRPVTREVLDLVRYLRS